MLRAMSAFIHRLKSAWPIFAGIVGGAFLLGYLFSDVMFGTEVLVFRDIGHFYRPLYHYLEARSAVEWFPLWSPLDSFGTPLAGETTTALFYPGRLILACGLPTERAIACYLATHLLLGGIGAGQLCRAVGASRYAAIIAVISYPLSGCVFFLYTNPPYLVGACWLPWILFFFHGLTLPGTSGRRALWGAAFCLAMCVLGGDPQMAAHAVMITVGWRFVRAVHRRWTFRFNQSAIFRQRGDENQNGVARRHLAVRFVAAIVLATLLAAPQMAAGSAWVSQSHRRASAPSSLPSRLIEGFVNRPDGPASENTNAKQSLSDSADATATRKDVYRFSLAPWHLAELVSPYLSGRFAPVNQRVTKLIPGEPAMWTPTIYGGLLTIIPLLITLPRPRYWTRWLVLAMLAFGLAMGRFGAYELLVQLIPGYSQFRFPSKWLPLGMLGMVVHASLVVTRHHLLGRKSLRWFCWSTAVLALTILLLSFLPMPQRVVVASNQSVTDEFWGPLDLDGAVAGLRLSMLHTAIIAMAVGTTTTTIAWFSKRDRRGRSRMAKTILTLIVVVDLGATAHWQLHTAEKRPPMPLAGDLTDRSQGEDSPFPPRFVMLSRGAEWPDRWSKQSAPDRFAIVDSYQQASWYKRWHLPANIHVLNNSLSILPERSVRFWDAVNRHVQGLAPKEKQTFFRRLGRFLALDGFVARREGELQLEMIDKPGPVIRWHDRSIAAEIANGNTAERIQQVAATLVDRIDAATGLPPPIIEIDADRLRNFLNGAASDGPRTETQIDVIDATPGRLRLRIRGDRAGVVQIVQMQEGGWRGEITRHGQQPPASIDVYPSDLVAQAVLVPAGDWDLRLFYRPWWFRPTITLSIATLIIACGWLAIDRRRSWSVRGR
jgi:hypothetical protein